MDDLVVDQRLAEGPALLAILDGDVDAVLQALDHVGRAEQPFFLELQHLHHEAGAFRADAVALRYADVIEEHLGGLRTAHAELVQVRTEGNARGLHRDHDQRLVDVRLVVGGIGEQAHEVGRRRVGDPHLAAVDHIVVAVLARGGLQAGDVGAGADLGDADAADHLAGDGRAEELLAQLVGTEAGQGRGAHVGLHADGHRDAAAGDAAEFLGGDDRVAVVQAHAAELLRLGDAQQAEFAGLAEDLVDREAAVLFPLVDVGVDFPLDEAANGAAEFLVFLGEDHGLSFLLGIIVFRQDPLALSQPSSFRESGERGCRRLACFSQNLATPKLLPFSGRASASAQISSR